MTVTIVKQGQVIQRQQSIGRVVAFGDDGHEQETTEVVEEIIVYETMARGGVKVGTTKNLGDYNSLRVDVSLFMPSKTDKKSLNKTFNKCFKWCDTKLDDIMADV